MGAIETLSLFGMSIVNATRTQAIGQMLDPGGAPRTAAFVNAHCINTALEDPVYRWSLSKADFVLPDGSGLQIAARMHGARFVENLNGTDLFLPLCEAAAARGMSVYFLGSQEGVAAAAAARACELVPGLRIAGTRNGYFSNADDGDVIAAINASGAGIVLVAMGVPTQDVWIARNRHRLAASLVLGVGAQFDFWSGRVQRAPMLLRKLGCEWCWRLLLEPRRLAKRYLIGNFRFMWHAFKASRTDRTPQPAGKRLFDLAVSGAAIALLSPLMAVVAAAVKFSSPGPVLFRQQRIGIDGRPFEVFKFRSMYADAEARRSALESQSDREGVCFKVRKDPRVTPVGRWLRRFSLDELPQLLNVWKGEMAIVGPRPALPKEVMNYPASAMERLRRKPGITGIWQVSGRAEIDFDRMVRMDRAYVGSRSVLLDLCLLLLTARAVLGGRGAY